jgi:hypothetical protein
MANAPVCNLTPPAPISTPLSKLIASIPVATDLPSAINALNAIRTVLNVQNNAIPPNNTVVWTGLKTTKPEPSKPTDKQPSNASSGQKRSGFTQSNVVTKLVKVTNPNDATQFVMVRQIVGLTMNNPVTGEQWQWTQSAGSQ